MMPDDDHRLDPAPRTGGRRTTYVFIAITLVMALLTLALPYLIHPSIPAAKP